jgi:hypothetical protein
LGCLTQLGSNLIQEIGFICRRLAFMQQSQFLWVWSKKY